MATVEAAPRRGLFYGWILLPSTLLVSWFAWSVWLVSLGPYVVPMTKELGWTRAFMMGPWAIGTAVGMYSGPIVGPFVDRLGPRIILMIGGFLLGLGALLNSFADVSWLFWYAGWILMCGMGYTWTSYLTTGKVLSNWFVRRRGMAMGLLTASGGFVYMATTLHAVFIESVGWRTSWRIWAVMIWVIVLGLSFLVLRNAPQMKGYKPDGVPMTAEDRAAWEEERRLSIREAVARGAVRAGDVRFGIFDVLKMWIFWVFLIAGVFAAFASPILNTQLAPLLQQRGITPIMAAAALGFAGLFGVPWRFIVGWVIDRIGKQYIRFFYSLSYLLMGAGILVLLFTYDVGMIWLYAFVYGTGLGMSVISFTLLMPQYFGVDVYATVYGTRNAFVALGSIFAPMIAAWVWDVTQSYDLALVGAIIVLVVAAVLVFFVAPPKVPVGAAAPQPAPAGGSSAS